MTLVQMVRILGYNRKSKSSDPMPFFDKYPHFRVAITVTRNKQVVRRFTPTVPNMRQAYALADKLKRNFKGDDYTLFRLADPDEAKKFQLGKLSKEDSEFFRKQ